MKIGLILFPTQEPIDAAAIGRRAEELGFDSLWVGEHPVLPLLIR